MHAAPAAAKCDRPARVLEGGQPHRRRRDERRGVVGAVRRRRREGVGAGRRRDRDARRPGRREQKRHRGVGVRREAALDLEAAHAAARVGRRQRQAERHLGRADGRALSDPDSRRPHDRGGAVGGRGGREVGQVRLLEDTGMHLPLEEVAAEVHVLAVGELGVDAQIGARRRRVPGARRGVDAARDRADHGHLVACICADLGEVAAHDELLGRSLADERDRVHVAVRRLRPAQLAAPELVGAHVAAAALVARVQVEGVRGQGQDRVVRMRLPGLEMAAGGIDRDEVRLVRAVHVVEESRRRRRPIPWTRAGSPARRRRPSGASR